MTLTLELTPEQQQRLEAEAMRRGMEAKDYALALVTQEAPADVGTLVEDETAELPAPGSMTPAEILAYWSREGILRPRPDLPDSPVYARQLREQAQTRLRE